MTLTCIHGCCRDILSKMKLLNFTLPDLEEDRLDSLTEGVLCQLSARDYERLFGVNNAAMGRLLCIGGLSTDRAHDGKTRVTRE